MEGYIKMLNNVGQPINNIVAYRAYSGPIAYVPSYQEYTRATQYPQEKENSSSKKIAYSTLGIMGGLAIAGAAFHVKMGSLIKRIGKEAPSSFFKRLSMISEIMSRDGMTGLYNKSALVTDIRKAYTDSVENKQNLSVAMFDMDNFKAINEIFDHKTGDTFLIRIAHNISEVCKKYGCKGYRYGGEEFVATMEGKTPREAMKIAKEIAERIKKDPELQKHIGAFRENIERELAFISPRRAKIDDPIFRMLRTHKNLTPEDAQTLSKQIIEILESHIKKYKPSNQVELEEFIGKLNGASKTDLPQILKIDMAVGQNSTLAAELDKISIQYKNMTNDLNKWLGHINRHGSFTISAGIVNLCKLKDGFEHGGESMISMADTMLGMSKERGKNNIISA